jgi:hypothetical protein
MSKALRGVLHQGVIMKSAFMRIVLAGVMTAAVVAVVETDALAAAPAAPNYVVPGPTASTVSASTYDVRLAVYYDYNVITGWQAVFTPSSGPVVIADCGSTSVQEMRISDQTITTPASAFCQVTGLTPSTAYTVKARAKNSATEWSAYSPDQASDFVTAAPPTPPSAPSITAAVSALGGAKLTVSTPTSNGGSSITGYKWRATSDGGTSYITGTCSGAPTPSIQLNQTNQTCNANSASLISGTTYVYSLAATNVAGDSSYSAATAGVTAKANLVVNSISSGAQSVRIAFTPPADAATSGIDGYSCLATAAGQTPVTLVTTTSPCTLTGLVMVSPTTSR